MATGNPNRKLIVSLEQMQLAAVVRDACRIHRFPSAHRDSSIHKWLPRLMGDPAAYEFGSGRGLLNTSERYAEYFSNASKVSL
jgi:hypothetical protein